MADDVPSYEIDGIVRCFIGDQFVDIVCSTNGGTSVRLLVLVREIEKIVEMFEERKKARSLRV